MYKSNNTVGIIVGRFQCPYLHAGYRELFKYVCDKHNRVIIFIETSSVKSGIHNPLSYDIRRNMLLLEFSNKEYINTNVEIHAINDIGNIPLWNIMLDSKIEMCVPATESVILYGSRDSFIKTYNGKYTTCEVMPVSDISATKIRTLLKEDISGLNNVYFRSGIVHCSQNRWSNSIACVDASIVNYKDSVLLLAKKATNDKYQFPGGFIDPAIDTSGESAIIREVMEETGISYKKYPSYIGSAMIDDPRYKHENDKIMTFLYELQYCGQACARDDISEIKWIPFSDLTYDIIVPQHRVLLEMVLVKIASTKYFNATIA